MIKIAELMTRTPYTLLRSNTLADAKKLMAEHDIRHVPVVDTEDKLLGLVTQRDILAAQDSSLQLNPNSECYTLETPLNLAMRKDVLTVSPRAGLRESAMMMQKRKVGCLPVISNQTLVGIITDSDFVAVAINLLELQEEVEPVEVDA
ncbi:acetoin utilization protein acuB [Vibrio ishigakensis]|uniref:Acetoin utilization protein acuB n=1 Tax=Vibrio ishigakensis TaxID=1481914 RepID=A0A0B8NTZ7_9VIBR|nr:CBS domain-containing protein [Vibrio ishigakensis]GAM54264.1 acetoin utilization protein acuB [Vibrio ishigakensis]